MQLELAVASGRGRRHAVNEDSYSALDRPSPVYVVADGVGGGAMASWASRELVQRLHAALDRRRVDADSMSDALLDADRDVGRAIARHTTASGAATVALCAGTGHLLSRWLIAWVGDCRIYRVRAAHDEPAELLTRDDTYGQLGENPPPGGSPDDPARMVGNGAVDVPNVESVDLGDGEMLVLCSDGLHKHVGPQEIHRQLRGRASLAHCCARLVELARIRGSSDDATVLAIHRTARPELVSAMTPEQIDRVFGRGRLRMVTGEHVEVFREAVAPGERRRYTKRFLNSTDGDFAHWTEREWRILARLIGHGIGCVPDVVQFDRGSVPGTQLVQTYDAGVTVDQWATLLPLLRDGRLYRHAFEDCAHWWALAHHCLVALKEIHQLQLVHLDIKGDNVCIPLGPADFDPDAPGHALHPMFGQLALIDFAFALVSGESLTAPLPIGRQEEYDYQSPRLLAALEAGPRRRPAADAGARLALRHLQPRRDARALPAGSTRRCIRRSARPAGRASGTTRRRALILTLREHHDRDAPQSHPHPELIDATGARLRESDLARRWLPAGRSRATSTSLRRARPR